MVDAGKSLNFIANCIVLSRTPKEEEQTRKNLRDKITRVVEELKKTWTQGSFLNCLEFLKNGKCILESP